MKHSLILLLIALSTTPSVGQSTPPWQQGSIVLSTNQVLVGEFMVHLDYNTLVYRSPTGVEVLPSFKIGSFRYYDEKQNINRQFITLGDSPKVATLYEIVVKGPYSIVRSVDRNHSFEMNDKEDYTYFILHEKTLIAITKFKKKVFPDLLNSRPDLSHWVKTEKLDLNKGKTAIVILKEYNRTYPTEMVASR